MYSDSHTGQAKSGFLVRDFRNISPEVDNYDICSRSRSLIQRTSITMHVTPGLKFEILLQSKTPRHSFNFRLLGTTEALILSLQPVFEPIGQRCVL